jgi:hypothetical protein
MLVGNVIEDIELQPLNAPDIVVTAFIVVGIVTDNKE